MGNCAYLDKNLLKLKGSHWYKGYTLSNCGLPLGHPQIGTVEFTFFDALSCRTYLMQLNDQQLDRNK
jgi:hypothetical protein